MKSPFFFLLLLLTASATLLCLGFAPGAAAATPRCDATQLSPCAGAIVGNAAPTAACCRQLKAQKPGCLCQYKKDPKLQRYVNSKNGKKVLAACRVPLPSC